MRASLPLPAGFVFVVLLSGCSAPHRQPSSEPPAIVISQAPDYPMPGHDSEFHGGLVIKFWRDGHMIRATRLDTVGKDYVEGFVPQASCNKFFASLGRSAAIHLPIGGGIPVDAACESITVRWDGKTSQWARPLPDKQSAWSEFELWLMSLPLSDCHRLDLKTVESMKWNE